MVYPGNTQKMDRNGTISVPNPRLLWPVSSGCGENETLIHAPRFFNAKKKKALRKPHYLLRSGRFSVVRCVDCVGCHVFVLFEITFRGTHILLLEQSGRLII
jgi:hypothetical protein